jgi:hypothetical protein
MSPARPEKNRIGEIILAASILGGVVGGVVLGCFYDDLVLCAVLLGGSCFLGPGFGIGFSIAVDVRIERIDVSEDMKTHRWFWTSVAFVVAAVGSGAAMSFTIVRNM